MTLSSIQLVLTKMTDYVILWGRYFPLLILNFEIGGLFFCSFM